MSTYYSYYLGYRTTDEKVHIYGPYDKFGNVECIFCRSRSFASQIYQDFIRIRAEKIGDDIIKDFMKVYDTTYIDRYEMNINYMLLDDLPSTDYIKSYFVPVDDALYYLNKIKEEDDYENIYFHKKYTIEEYALATNNAIRENDEKKIKELSDYVYFSYPDYNSKEYESFLVQNYIKDSVELYEMEKHIRSAGEDLLDIGIVLDIG